MVIINTGNLDQNFQFKGIFNAQAEEFQIKLNDDAEFLRNKRNAEKIKETLKPFYWNIKILSNKIFTYPIVYATCLDQIYHKDQKPQ
jgi:hypothetical protein